MKKFFSEMPVFAVVLGLCSTLAVSTTFENSYVIGLSVLVILIFSNIFISLISRFTKERVRIPVFILIIASFVILTELLFKEYIPSMYDALGIYLPLIAVNCMILGRALSYASKNNVLKSILDSLKYGFGYIFVISILGIVREILGNNTLTLMDKLSGLTGYRAIYKILPDNLIIPNSVFLSGAGLFIILGIIIGIYNGIRNRGEVE